MRLPALAAVLLACVAGRPVSAAEMEYRGLCEASAAASLDGGHFAVASDETNRLHVYQRGTSAPIGAGFDLEPDTGFGKSDLEAAARIGDRIYWISSHSLTRKGEDRSARRLFVATQVTMTGGVPVLSLAGKPYGELRDPLLAAAGIGADRLNVEGLAATPEGGLLIGLRSPLAGKKAILLPFDNPAAVVETGAAPRFGGPIHVALDGLGIRSIDRVGDGERRYLIVAGPVGDADEGYAAFWWSGAPDQAPRRIPGLDFRKFHPEAVVAFPDAPRLLALSDDARICSDEGDPAQRRFRAQVLDAGVK